MTVALVSTKRKFHQVLDSLTNVSSTSLKSSDGAKRLSTSSSQTWNEPPTKKFRVARPDSASVARSPRTNPHLSSTQQSSHTATPTNTSDDMVRDLDLPNYLPNHRGQFLKRLETFKDVTKWGIKPDRVNEVQWAKRGWTCVGKERVGCIGGCEKQVVIKLARTRDEETGGQGSAQAQEQEQDWASEIDEQLVDRYANIIVTGHAELCNWRRHGCADTIYKLQLVQPHISLPALRARYESLRLIDSSLPYLTAPDFDPHSMFNPLPKEFANLPSGSPLYFSRLSGDHPYFFDKEALILARYGWQVPNTNYKQIQCESCFRRLGLWLYERKGIITGTTDTTAHSTADNEHRQTVYAKLDPVGEHRHYCPWINAVSQCGETKNAKAGWEVLTEVIANAQKSQRCEVPQPALPATTSGTTSAPAAEEAAEQNEVEGGEEQVGLASAANIPVSKEARDAKDKQRVSKLKKLTEMFKWKGRKGRKGKKGAEAGAGAGGAGAAGGAGVGAGVGVAGSSAGAAAATSG